MTRPASVQKESANWGHLEDTTRQPLEAQTNTARRGKGKKCQRGKTKNNPYIFVSGREDEVRREGSLGGGDWLRCVVNTC